MIPSWTVSNIIHEAIHIINSFKLCVISHNYRETNGSADWVANVACKNDDTIL